MNSPRTILQKHYEKGMAMNWGTHMKDDAKPLHRSTHRPSAPAYLPRNTRNTRDTRKVYRQGPNQVSHWPRGPRRSPSRGRRSRRSPSISSRHTSPYNRRYSPSRTPPRTQRRPRFFNEATGTYIAASPVVK